MTVGQWYQYLLEDRVKDKEGRRTAKRCSVEELQPEVNWGRSFSLARVKGLLPDNKSVLLKVLHQLLPTGERFARLQPNKSLACSLCRTGPVDTLLHAIKDVSAKLRLKTWKSSKSEICKAKKLKVHQSAFLIK